MQENRREAGALLRARGAAVDVYTAAWLGDLAEVKRRLPRRWLKEAKPGRGGYTVLQQAVRGGARDVVAWLIAAGVRVDEPADWVAPEPTALWLAANLGRTEILDMLLEAGADPTVRDRHGRTVLDLWGRVDERARDQLAPRFRQLGLDIPEVAIASGPPDKIKLEHDWAEAAGGEQLQEIALVSDVIQVAAAGIDDPDPLTRGYERVAVRCAREHAYLETERAADDQLREREALAPGPSVVTSLARHNLGRARFHLLRDDAGALLEQALRELRALAADDGWVLAAVAIAIDNVGQVLQRAGRPVEAEARFREALGIREKERIGTIADLARSYGQLGALHTELGRYAEAERELTKALSLRMTGWSEEQEVVTSLNNLAVLRDLIGDHLGASKLYQALLERLTKVGRRSLPLAVAHYNVASAEAHAGHLDVALQHMDVALRMARGTTPRGSYIEGRMRLGRATVLAKLGRADDALAAAREALGAIERVHGAAGGYVARAHRFVGELALGRGALDEARRELGLGMALATESGALEELWPAQLGYARLLARRGATGPAVLLAKEAVRTIERLRAGVRDIDGGRLDFAFAEDRQDAYRFLADELFALGRLPEAMDVLGLLKASELDAFAVRGRANAAGTAADPVPTVPSEAPLEERFAAVRDELTARGAELAALREKKQRVGADGLTAAEQARLVELRGVVELGRKAFDAYLASLDRDIALLPVPRAMALAALDIKRVRSMQGTLRALGDGVVLVHYLAVEGRLRILLTTPDVQLAREVPIAGDSLGRLIGRFRELLEEPTSDPKPLAKRFYELLVAPIAEDLEAAHAKTLMLSLDGPLRYLPFDALWDGERWLVERFRTVLFTQAAKDKLKDERTPKWTLAGLGLARAVGRFVALPAVKDELEHIVRRQKERDPDGVVDGIVRLDQAFTAEALRDALEAGYPVIHIASHFEFRPGTERDSFLLLGTGDELSLEQIRYDGYPFGAVELLTLSACNTAVGAGGDGAEVEGFAALAQELGARGVLATLWSVADASTGKLMTAMYRQHEADPTLTKAEALRRAKLELLKGHPPEGDELEPTGFPPPSEEPPPIGPPPPPAKLAHPYYWAPFV
ncbi:MAG: CHAT domain-containing protein, partial [Myxococcales bacterium]|nr:CHAT domain-containing protein [Myxococcales bacterium]